jgi:hypothetical protein
LPSDHEGRQRRRAELVGENDGRDSINRAKHPTHPALLDHFGWVGFEPHRAGIARLLGCGLMMAGLVLIDKF